MYELADSGVLDDYQAGDADLLVAAAEAEVRGYCGWHIFPSRTDTVTVNGSGQVALPLPSLHLTDVASVSESTAFCGTVTTTALTADVDYDWSEAGYLTRTGQRWTSKLRGVTVTFTHGYTDLPPEVQAVVAAVAARAQESAQGGGVDMAGPFRYTPTKNPDGSTGGVSLTDAEKAVLVRYRVPAS